MTNRLYHRNANILKIGDLLSQINWVIILANNYVNNDVNKIINICYTILMILRIYFYDILIKTVHLTCSKYNNKIHYMYY